MGTKARNKKYRLSINIQTSETCVREPTDDDDWDVGDVEISFEGIEAYRIESFYGEGEDVPAPGTMVYVLIEVVDSGSTFGSTTNNHYERGWFRTYESAKKKADATPKNNDYFGGHKYWRIEPVVVTEGPRFF